MKKYANLILYIIISSYCFSINFDKTFNISTFSVNEGLSQFDAPRIIQDHYGFIWVATYDGLNRYDGNGFVQYRHDPFNETSIHGNRVLVLYKDSRNSFWVVTESGKIDKFNYQTEQFEHFDFEPLKYSIITAFYEDKFHNYWIGTTNGLYKTTLNENKFQVDGIFQNSSSPGYENFITCMIEDEQHGILVGTVSGGVLLSYRGGRIYSPSKFLQNVQINSFFKDRFKTIWICNNYGLWYVKNKKSEIKEIRKISDIQPLSNFSIPNIRAMAPIDNSNFCILSGNSVYIYNQPSGGIHEIKLNNDDFFKNNIIKSLLIDKTKNIWISSGQKGVAKIDLFEKPNIINGKIETKGMFVKSVFKDSKDRVWIGTNLNGMYYYDKDGIVKRLEIDGIYTPISYISPSIVEDKRGNIWFCANAEVYCYNYSSKKAISLKSMYPNLQKVDLPFSFDIDHNDHIWIGCASGLIRLNLNDRKSTPKFIAIGSLSDMVSSEQISRILYDSIHNMVWACTKDNGVTVLKLNKAGNIQFVKRLVHSTNKNSISSDHVWSVLLGTDSTVWFGTDSGLNKCVITGDSITVNPVNTQTIGNVKIMSMAEDQYNNIWLGTSQALYCYHTKSKIEKKFTVANGLFSNGMLEGMYSDKNGLVYVGTINGMNMVNTTPQSYSPFNAEVQIVDFKIFGKSIKNDLKLSSHLKVPLYNTNEIQLKYNENNFTLSFLATHYNDFEKNLYVYKLEGFDTDSITVDSRNRTVTYNNLPAGTYRFWVKASNNDNNWGGSKRYLTVVVKSAPWLTIWAFIFYLMLILGFLYVVYRYLSRETKLKQQLVIKELENEHEVEINSMRLRFHTNIAHDIRTPLTLIAAPLEDIKHDTAITSNPFLNDRIGIIEKNVSRLLYLVNQFLDFRRLLNDGITLHPDTHFVHTAFNDIKASFSGLAHSKNIHYEFVIDVNDNYLVFDIDKLTKILFNLISNAFKYTPEGGDIFVFIDQQNETLVLKVQDTGSGISDKDLPNIFQRFYQASETENGTGIGLALVKQLVDLCKGTIEAQSTEGKGTQFTVTIPCQIASEVVQTDNIIISEDDNKIEISNKKDDGRKALVLVVEDDDDLRAYLVKSLQLKYTVFEAVNGQDGFDKALRYTPDIIISDIMMPQVDGIALIQMVRNDYRTSHIPIIVLTAKIGEKEEIIALEAGAEDFIAKPFSTKTLLLKVNNYLRNLSNRKHSDDGGDDVKLKDREQLFLNKMNKVILNNLESPLFCIDFICEKMAISRMQLHRKMVALIGKSTSEYIREIKLDQGKKYFEKGERDIETVMLKIGVNSIFHFNKNFKARYGMSIQDFIKSLKKENV